MIDQKALADFASWDATELAHRITTGDLTAEQALSSSLAIIESVDPSVNAFVELEEDIAWRSLESASSGPLKGVPIAMKDCLGFVAGASRRFGSRLTQRTQLARDDEMITRLRRLGLVPLGTTNVPEFSSSITTESVLYGPCRNPWSPHHSVGGSTGGGAAAVAYGAVPVAYGNDSAGSIRIPASCCGLFGLKPSRGRVPTGPDFSEVWFGLMVQHVITRSVRDSALILDGIEGIDLGAPYDAPQKTAPFIETTKQDPSRLRIALSDGFRNGISIDADCSEGLSNAAAMLEDLGHEVVEASPPFVMEELEHHMNTILSVSLALELEAAAAESSTQVGTATVEPCQFALFSRGRETDAITLAQALDYKNTLARQVGAFLAGFDVLLTPTLASAPVELGYLNARQSDLD
ncbi:MAG: amidase, partial [Pseudomonadota bacterium]